MSKLCSFCSVTLGESDAQVTTRALQHWVDEHHDSEQLYDILSDVWVRIDCSGCGQPFYSTVGHGPGTLAADAYCPECIEDDPLLKIYAREMSANGVVACQVDPVEASVEAATDA